MSNSDIPVVILAGGLGTRIREETEFKPKPMIEIGGFPIIWHLMKNFSSQGFNNFIICAGYKANIVKDYFLNYEAHSSNVKIGLGKNKSISFMDGYHDVDWNIQIIDTGIETQTGGRIAKISKYLNSDRFLCTYGDGLSNISVESLLKSHVEAGTIGTVSVVNPESRFGVIDVSKDNKVLSFREKPVMDSLINAGYFVFESEFLRYLDFDSVLEKDPLIKLSLEGELSSYHHKGFWQPMDTFREMQILNDLWSHGSAPWKNWT